MIELIFSQRVSYRIVLIQGERTVNREFNILLK